IVEQAEIFTLFDNPKHPYTKVLLDSRPSLDDIFEGIKMLKTIKGNVLSPYTTQSYCLFYDRCDMCTQNCKQKSFPLLKQIDKHHKVACHLVEEDKK
ncbi:MAG: oligopeptide/dipeptide ABC transporter ATP-binding protein, partial [Sarcina sp.]